MPKKIPQEKIALIERLSGKGLSAAEVARQAGVSYSTAYGYTLARQRTIEKDAGIQKGI